MTLPHERLNELKKRCVLQRRSHAEFGEDCKRAYTMKDGCGKVWGFAWIHQGEGKDYRVTSYLFGGKSRFERYNSAFKALKSIKLKHIKAI